ncbi:bifunctional ligase/repressor BirA [Spirochaetia bacterium]|nr:bifunctional ligase/repressor BirA [Spirochaetia bacterium]
MVDKNPALSTRASLLAELRKKQGAPLSGSGFAKTLGVSRTAVWKAVQGLVAAGYAIETLDTGYSLDPEKEGDFLYPWEFGDKEDLFRHFDNTGSTMDRARELAWQGAPGGTVITAEKQSAGRGRNGRVWTSRQGGLFFTILDRPALAIADYTLPALMLQIAVARALSAICGKQARLRWPNDIYIDQRKIAGIITEISGEGDMVSWLTGGVGINVNNPAPSGKITSCAEIAGRKVSRREVLRKTLDEIELVKRRFSPGAAYTQGNRALAAEWNSLADCPGAKAAVIDPGYGEKKEAALYDKQNKVLARGVFSGIDPAGRCIIKTDTGKGNLYFNPGPVSLMFS